MQPTPTINPNIALYISLALTIVVLAANTFTPQLGANIVKLITDSSFAIVAALHLPQIIQPVSSIFKRKTQ